MKANQDKCDFISSLDITTKPSSSDCSVKNLSSKKLIRLIIDRKFDFNEHITNLCNKARNKIQVIVRIIPYMPVTQRKLQGHSSKFSLNAYFLSQFGYNSLVWINHSSILNNLVKRLQEKPLTLVVHSDFSFTFS